MKNNKTTTFFIFFLVIIFGVYLYFIQGINVESIVSKSIEKLIANSSTISKSQKGEVSDPQFMQSYYLIPTSNLYKVKK